MTPLRVVVAEDEFLVRQALEALVSGESEWELVGSCTDADGLLDAVDRHRPDVVITDIRMPPGRTDEGIRVARMLRTTHPGIGVLVLSQHADPWYVLDLLSGDLQRRGYLLKQHLAGPGQLRQAVRAVAAGGSFIDPEVIRVWARVQARPEPEPLAGLTARERQVLAAMARGRNNPAIAAELGVSSRAVEKHINAIFAKLAVSADPDAHGRVQAVLTYLASIGAAEPGEA